MIVISNEPKHLLCPDWKLTVTSEDNVICKKAASVTLDQFKKQVKRIFGRNKRWKFADESQQVDSCYTYIAITNIEFIRIDIRLVRKDGKYDLFISRMDYGFSNFSDVEHKIKKVLRVTYSKLHKLVG